MAFTPSAHGGAFKAPSATQSFTHGHASQMEHSAQRRLAVAKALSGGPKAPSAPAAAAPVAPVGAPPVGGNFKATVAHAAGTKGVHVTMNHVHSAIDALTQKGALTPFQGAALKGHNGPLQGPAGMQTMGAITNELVTNPRTRQGA